MKFGQKLVYIILKHLQKNAVENITLSPRKLISKFWSTGATMGGRGLNKKKIHPFEMLPAVVDRECVSFMMFMCGGCVRAFVSVCGLWKWMSITRLD